MDAAVTPDAAAPARDAGMMDAATPPDAAGPSTLDPQRLLHAQEGQLVHADGRAMDFRGAISCCGGAMGWPLYDESWVDLVEGFNFNTLHVRLGPFLTGANGESDWATVGGAYVETNGKADLTRFNEVFWARVRQLLTYARDRGFYVEVDVVDAWAVKHCQWGDLPGYSAWDATFNHQEQDWCTGTGSAAITPGSVVDHWVRKVVFETGRFDNVIYQDGNEVSLVADYSAAYTASMATILHDEETQRGYPRHLFGTQSNDAEAMALPDVDFLEFHQNNALDPNRCLGKPCLVNEYNPNPSLTPAQLHQRYCTARSNGTYFWYWRHGQDQTAMVETLGLIGAGCP